MDIQTIISYITSPELQEKLFLVRIVFIGFTAFFFVAVVYYFFKTEWVREVILRDFAQFFFKRAYGLKKPARQWDRVKRRLETGVESEWKLSVMEADDILDDILAKMGYVAETLEERLKLVPVTILPNLDEIQKVHKIRDNIVHDPDFRLTMEQARAALEVYERAFSDLEAF